MLVGLGLLLLRISAWRERYKSSGDDPFKEVKNEDGHTNIATADSVPGKKVVGSLGLVCGSSVRARHLGREISAAFRNVVG